MKTKTGLIIFSILLLALLSFVVVQIFSLANLDNNSSETPLNSGAQRWAVLMEMNDFPPIGTEDDSDLPVGFINSQRMQTALLNLDWQNDHIYTVRGYLSKAVVQEAVQWLLDKTDSDDIALLYIFTHGSWMRTSIEWNYWFPTKWERLNTTRRILIVDTCMAEEFIAPIKSDLSPHISLACCSANELGWCGVEEEGLPIIGSVWNYYFTNALHNQSADLNSDGHISIEEAFNFSKPLTQQYMNETVFVVPEFLQQYHDSGQHPEDFDAYPHPVMDDGYSEQLIIPESTPLTILSVFMTGTLSMVIVSKRKSKYFPN